MEIDVIVSVLVALKNMQIYEEHITVPYFLESSGWKAFRCRDGR